MLLVSSLFDNTHYTSLIQTAFKLKLPYQATEDGNRNTNRINCTIWENRIKQKSITLTWLHFQTNTCLVIIGSIHIRAILPIKHSKYSIWLMFLVVNDVKRKATSSIWAYGGLNSYLEWKHGFSTLFNISQVQQERSHLNFWTLKCKAK